MTIVDPRNCGLAARGVGKLFSAQMSDFWRLEMQTQTVAHVTLGKGKDTVAKTIAAGPTMIPVLKTELGVPETDVLYLRHGNDKRVLGDAETIDVVDGMHFEA